MWEIFEQPPYSPDLAPSDFYSPSKLKQFLGGKQLDNNEDLKEAVISWLQFWWLTSATSAFKNWFHDSTSAMTALVTISL